MEAEEEEAEVLVWDAWFQARGFHALVAHQLDSFNRFCCTQAVDTENADTQDLASLFRLGSYFNDIKGPVTLPNGASAVATIRLDNLSLHRPADNHRPLLPPEARLRNLTYSARLSADIHLQVDATGDRCDCTTIVRSFSGVHIGSIPVMVQSDLCNQHHGDAFDCGGYFIVKGVDKVVIAQDYVSPQALRVLCPKAGSGNWKVELEDVKVELESSGSVLLLSAPGLETLPLVIALAAYGVCSDKQLLQVMVHDCQDAQLTELVAPSIVDARGKMQEFVNGNGNSDDARDVASVALEYVGSRVKVVGVTSMVDAAKQKLANLLCNTTSRVAADKALLIGYMVRCLCLCAVGRSTADDADNLANRKVDLAGNCMFKHMRHLSVRFRKSTFRNVCKFVQAGRLDGIAHSLIVDKSVITNGLLAVFESGTWSLTKHSIGVLQWGNPMLVLSQLRQVRSASRFVAKDSRIPNASHYGRLCPVETPDDHLAKSMAMFAVVSASRAKDDVLEHLSHCQMQSLDGAATLLAGWDNVFVNGQWVGATSNPGILLQAMRNLRRNREIHPETEMARVPSRAEIRIFTDGGRLLRPLLVVNDKNDVLVFTGEHIRLLRSMARGKRFNYMLKAGLVELVGAQEESNAVVAVTRGEVENSSDINFTHMEMHPASLLGVSAGAIPFLNHNHSNRVTHQAQKHGKQAIGLYTCNLLSRMDPAAAQLYYPQKPLVRSQLAQHLGRPELTNGINCVVAVACYTGYNQEDSLVLNKASVDRGLFRSTHFRVHKASLDAADKRFGKPDAEAARSSSISVDNLDSDGLPYIGAQMKAGDVVIGKVTPGKPASKFIDLCSKVRNMEQGWVDQVVCSAGEEQGQRHARVRLREARWPQVGDKFSSMHGQKGVVGMMLCQEDLLFTQHGLVPDIVINPHAFPSRQTLAQMLESLAGGMAATASILRIPSCTPFAHPGAEEMLAACGFRRWGQERVYSGRSGRPMESMVTLGLTFYQRLNHLSEDKMKWRGGRGPVHPLTHQPVKDRKREGGTRFGEMERDCLVAHGAAATVQERLFIVSDKSRVVVCANCQRLAYIDSGQQPSCLFCKQQQQHLITIEMPHACKLLGLELKSMGVDIRFQASRWH